VILILTQCFPPTIGGIELLMKGLADGVAARGFKVAVYADSRRDMLEEKADSQAAYSVRRFGGFKPLRRRRKARAVAAALARGGISGIFCDSWKSAEYTARAARHSAVPVVALAHGSELLEPMGTFKRGRIRRTLRECHRVIANSMDTAARVKALGIDPTRISLVYPGVSKPRRADPSTAKAVPGGHPRLLTLSRIETRKGLGQVLRCLPDLIGQYPELSYVIGGDGPEKARLRALATQLKVSRHVHFLGWLNDEEKADVLTDCDVYVMPVIKPNGQRSVEGFGLAYIEAGYFGVPCIAGMYGGAVEAVIDGETGIICDGENVDELAAAIRRCLEDDELRRRLGNTARRRAENEFTWDKAVVRYLECLR